MPQIPKPEEIKEEKEFLAREEIKTMQKDIARLREIEAKKERERIAALKAKEEKPKPPPPPTLPIPLKEERLPPTLRSLIPKPAAIRPSPFKKVLVRGIILIFCLFLFGFFYWLWAVKRPPVEEVTPPAEEIIPPPEEVVEKPKIIIPPPLILVEEIRTSEISTLEEIPEIFNWLMKEELPGESFTRLVIINLPENRLVSLEEMAEAFQIEVPEELYQKLSPDYTLALYSQRQGKRVALITKVKEEEGLSDLLKNRESKIKTEGFFISGQKISGLVPYFKTFFYKNIGFRYLTISKEDLGICYAWFDDNFVITSSFESMKKIIEELTFEKKLGQLFIVGFEGKTLTPELEAFFKKYKPGGILLLSKNIESKEQLKTLISDLQNLSLKETGLPLLVAVDQEGGLISRIDFLSEKTPQSEIETPEMAYQIGLKRAGELKELGVNLNLAPLLDFLQEGDYLFERSFQKTPEEIGELAKSLVSGQKAGEVLTAIKHFPGYGGISFDPEEELAELERTPQFSQFKTVRAVKPELVMTSNVIYKEIDSSLPFTFSPKAVQFLKNNLGSEILIVSDDLDQNSLLNKFSLKEKVTKPIEAGVDILIFSGYRTPVEQGLDAFFEAVKNREISAEKVNAAVSKVIQFKKTMLK